MWKIKVLIFAFVMLISGTINTVTTKYQDNTIVGYDKYNQKPIKFQHPIYQSFLMFIGEALCLVPFVFQYYSIFKPKRVSQVLDMESSNQVNEQIQSRAQIFRNKTFKQKVKVVAIFAFPTLCDVGATTLLNVGLFYTYASTFQMLRGTLVLFTDLFTVIILRRAMRLQHYMGCFFIIVGALLVGLASVISQQATDRSNADNQGNSASSLIFGDTLIIVAQALQALQIIIEEKFIGTLHVPGLAAVGMEGVWGCFICLIFFGFSNVIRMPNGQAVDDLRVSILQTFQNSNLLIQCVISIFAIGFFNYSGISVTRNISGTARSTVDQCRTLLVWLYALFIPNPPWEQFHVLQIAGFTALVSGTLIHNDIHEWIQEVLNQRKFIHNQVTQNSAISNQDLQDPLLQHQSHTDNQLKQEYLANTEVKAIEREQPIMDKKHQDKDSASSLGTSIFRFHGINLLKQKWHPSQQVQQQSNDQKNSDTFKPNIQAKENEFFNNIQKPLSQEEIQRNQVLKNQSSFYQQSNFAQQLDEQNQPYTQQNLVTQQQDGSVDSYDPCQKQTQESTQQFHMRKKG